MLVCPTNSNSNSDSVGDNEEDLLLEQPDNDKVLEDDDIFFIRLFLPVLPNGKVFLFFFDFIITTKKV